MNVALDYQIVHFVLDFLISLEKKYHHVSRGGVDYYNADIDRYGSEDDSDIEEEDPESEDSDTAKPEEEASEDEIPLRKRKNISDNVSQDKKQRTNLASMRFVK